MVALIRDKKMCLYIVKGVHHYLRLWISIFN